MPRMILAIDPGPVESAWTLIRPADCQPVEIAKYHNPDMLDMLRTLDPDHTVAIEMIASYGMAVGADVFDTCVWIGRYDEAVRGAALVKRLDVKLHHCHSAKAKDSNVTQALIDRFAPSQPNRGKGTKTRPGWFHGFARDIWQAYALAVYVADHTRVQP